MRVRRQWWIWLGRLALLGAVIAALGGQIRIACLLLVVGIAAMLLRSLRRV